MRYTPWVVSEHVPDTSSIGNLVASPRFKGLKGEALAVALWQYMVDRELGIFHYCPAQESLWKKDCHDPLHIFNVYGFTICHVHAHVLAMLARAAGFQARVANIRGHEGSEMFYDGGWHYFDADVQYFHRRRGAPYEIASREELFRDPSLVDDQPRPSNPYGLPDRLPQSFRSLYESEPEYPELLEEKIHGVDYRLRPGEEMVRYFHHRGRWHVFENYPQMFAQYPAETGPEGPTERFWPRRQWGNGYFRYAPRLTSEYRDVELGADQMQNVEVRPEGLVSGSINRRATLAFDFESPYIFCGIPDPLRRVKPSGGATLGALFEIPPGATVDIHINGWSWFSNGATGVVAVHEDFTAAVDGQFSAELVIHFSGSGIVLKKLETKLWFMVSPHSLPALKNAGENKLLLHSGNIGKSTRRFLYEERFDREYSTTPFEEIGTKTCVNLRHDSKTYSLLLPVDGSKPWSVAYPLQADTGGQIESVCAYALFEARRPEDPEESAPAKIEIADSAEGPWRKIGERPLAVHPQGWHFGLFGEGQFSGTGDTGFIRFSSKKGMKGVRIATRYIPAQALSQSAQLPLEIEHAWYEDDPRVGRRLKTHTHRTDLEREEYVVRCEHEPHNESIALRVPSVRR